MATAFQSFLDSELFTFVVGESQKTIKVHSAAISHVSPVLKAMMEVPMRESSQRSACLPDILETTFVRFCQFAYTGEYDYFEPDLLPNAVSDNVTRTNAGEYEVARDPSPVPIDAQRESGPWGSFGSGKKTPSRKERAQNSFNELHASAVVDPGIRVPRNDPVYRNLENESYEQVYLGYARLYVFADRYQIKSLSECTLHKLHKTLLATPMCNSRAEDVVQLIRYTYDNTQTLEHDWDSLRTLVTFYAATQVAEITKHDSFQSFLQEEGPFARDFILLLQKHWL